VTRKQSIALSLLIILGAFPLQAQVELRYEENITPTWSETISMYRWLDAQYEEARLMVVGMSDAGKPIHLFVISSKGLFDPVKIREAGQGILFINNGIHPGEPCGIDASLKLADGLLSGEDTCSSFLENTVVAIVPILNIGGALQRSPHNRANQNGPVEQGFRGNARNLDLNRDFIKLDSRNTRTLSRVLRNWEPDIFVDTHTSNGADYPYTITLINSHEQRHEKSQAALMKNHLKPWLFSAMKKTPYEMSPYIWSIGRSPDEGIIGFMDYPRYTSGYASLYNALAFTVETHMFKPYRDRVLSTWHLLRKFMEYNSLHREKIASAKASAWEEKLENQNFVLKWEIDTSRFEMIPFRGYASRTAISEVTGMERQWYDRSSSWEKEIPYYHYFSPVISAEVPEYYVLPYAWGEVAERLRLNGVSMRALEEDTLMEVEVSYIEDYQTYQRPYNGHYPHSEVKVRTGIETLQFYAGDLLIPLDQKAREYLVQSLEARGNDSFFAWNFFDEILFRNEYFSPYIFEETARDLLEQDGKLEAAFEKRRKEDADFKTNAYAQLRFIYENSPWSEPTHLRYPVYRIPQGASDTESSIRQDW